MISTQSAGIDSSNMETLGEGEPQDILLDGGDLEEEFDDDEDVDIVILDDEELECDFNNDAIPEEVSEYILSLETQTRQLENELLDCDELLAYSGPSAPVDAMVPFEDYQYMENEAVAHGMTVEAFRQKLLQDVANEDFNQSDIDREFEELAMLQSEFAQIRAEAASVTSHRSFETRSDMLALEGPTNSEGDNYSEQNDTAQPEQSRNKEKGIVGLDRIEGILVSNSSLTDMRTFIEEQLISTDQWYSDRRQKLQQSIENQKHEEENRTTREKERREKFHKMLEQEEKAVQARNVEEERKLEQTIKDMDEQTAQELNIQQVEIERAVEQLESEQHHFEVLQQELKERESLQRKTAATCIQRIYRGYRTRRDLSPAIAELKEWRELRKMEQYDLRVMEIEYQMKYREEQAKKEKKEQEKSEEEEKKRKEEMEKQKEIQRLKQDEEKRIKEEREKGEKKRKEELSLEEERKNKELEEKKKEDERKQKEAEKQRKEKEKQLKEEEKQRKEEEKKRNQEEEEKRKEENKLRKAEEKRQKEEEKKQKAVKEMMKREAENGEQNGLVDKGMVNKGAEKNEDTEESEKGKPDTRVIYPLSDISENGADSNLKFSGHISVTEEEIVDNSSMSNATVQENGIHSQVELSKVSGEKEVSEGEQPASKEVSNQVVNQVLKPARFPPSPSPVANFSPCPPSHPPSQGGKFATTQRPRSSEATAVTSIAPTMSAPSPPKPDPVEILRLNWMRACLPWSNVSNEPWRLKLTSQKPHKRPGSAKKCLALDEDLVLSAAHAQSLREVSSVKLSELPGCSLSTLGQCWSLRYLTITHSGLVCLDGLSQCRHLHYINAEHSQIEYLDLKDMGSLQVVTLAHNRVSAIHGLDGCLNLRWLNLSHNRITRLGGLSSLRRLHTLDLSHNQLVNSAGINDLVTLQQIDMSHNYLQSLDALDKLCLLKELNLTANNLQQMPKLKNHVLLRRLNLSENSLRSVSGLAEYWLPLLTTLSCGQNMLDSITGLHSLILLSHLDIGNNQISELEVMISSLPMTSRLKQLIIQGNPVVDMYADQYRDILLEALPCLREVDGHIFAPPSVEESKLGMDRNPEFVAMCLDQTKVHDEVWKEFTAQIKSFQSNNLVTAETICYTIFTFCDISFRMAAEHRVAHEYADLTTTSTISHFINTSASNFIDEESKLDASLVKTNTNYSLDKKSKFEAALASQTVKSAKASLDLESPKCSIVDNDNLVNGGEYFQANSLRQSQFNGTTSFQNREKNERNDKYKATQINSELRTSKGQGSKMVNASSDESDSDGGVDTTDFPSDDSGRVGEQVPAMSQARSDGMPYMNEKDKFELALMGEGNNRVKLSSGIQTVSDQNMNNSNLQHEPQYSNPSQNSRNNGTPMSLNHFDSSIGTKSPGMDRSNLSHWSSQARSQRDLFEQTLPGPNEVHGNANVTVPINPKDEFNAALQSETTAQKCPRVTADIVGGELTRNIARDGLGDLDLNDDLEFDIDKYLDMGELDEFLEKGWRPSESPQILQSSYPVLGRINSADFSNNNISDSRNSRPPAFPYSVPPPPPTQAWRDSPVLELKGKPPCPSPHSVPHPSPSQLSVASAAETLGGGSVRSNSKKEELSHEWGFKDERTAEIMMARAKKMKYNAERRKKLSKLDPQQRYLLFRKLEESGKIRHVRPPPAKVLPRKEYFQAREEEAQQQEFDRRREQGTRVNRTFEWIHTQVGDHPVSSSRIDPG